MIKMLLFSGQEAYGTYFYLMYNTKVWIYKAPNISSYVELNYSLSTNPLICVKVLTFTFWS